MKTSDDLRGRDWQASMVAGEVIGRRGIGGMLIVTSNCVFMLRDGRIDHPTHDAYTGLVMPSTMVHSAILRYLFATYQASISFYTTPRLPITITPLIRYDES